VPTPLRLLPIPEKDLFFPFALHLKKN
jgi:hypothetical protein